MQKNKKPPQFLPKTNSTPPEGLVRTIGRGVFHIVGLTPSGDRIVSSGSGSIKVWDWQSGEEINSINLNNSDRVAATALTSDGKHVVCAFWDNTIKIWDCQTGEKVFEDISNEIRIRTGDRHETSAIAFTQDAKYLIHGGKTLKVRDWRTNKEIAVLLTWTDNSLALGIALTLDYQYLISGHNDGTLRLWDLRTKTAIATYETDHAIRCCAISPDGTTIIIGETSGKVNFYSWKTDN